MHRKTGSEKACRRNAKASCTETRHTYTTRKTGERKPDTKRKESVNLHTHTQKERKTERDKNERTSYRTTDRYSITRTLCRKTARPVYTQAKRKIG